MVKKRRLGHWSKPVTRLPLLHAWITHAGMQTVINLPKERKLKNLPGKAEGDGAHDWLFSLGGEETSHDWGTGERWPQEHDGGEEGYLLAGHSPLVLFLSSGSSSVFFGLIYYFSLGFSPPLVLSSCPVRFPLGFALVFFSVHSSPLRVCLCPAFIRPEIDWRCNGRLLNAL